MIQGLKSASDAFVRRGGRLDRLDSGGDAVDLEAHNLIFLADSKSRFDHWSVRF